MLVPYPVDLQAAHLADGLAIHADDAGVPVEPGEVGGQRPGGARPGSWSKSPTSR